MGTFLLQSQDIDSLACVADTLLSRFPSLSEAHVLRGHVLKIMGQPELAAAAYRQGLTLEPTSASALYNLVDLQPRSVSADCISQMETLRTQRTSDGDRANVCFALGRTYDALDECDRAFNCFEEANSATVSLMRSKGLHYDPRAVDQSVSNTVAAYKRGNFMPALERMDLDLTLIFIVGLPRSGTTLVEQIVACHEGISAGGELPLVQECLQEFENRGADNTNVTLLEEMRELYLDGLCARGLDQPIVTDKLPGNFADLGFIRQLFPDSVIVHCRREPIALCWSLFTANFSAHAPYYNSFEHLAHYHRAYERIMEYWASVLTAPIIDVRYEDLALGLETESRRLITRCGLEWHPRCLQFHSLERPIHTASQVQARQPIYQTSIEKWRRYDRHIPRVIKDLQQCIP